MDNPLKVIRTYNGYSLENLSNMTDVTRQYIDQLEKGFYEVPNFSVLKIYSRISGEELGVSELTRLYNEWRLHHRLESRERYNLRPIKDHLLQRRLMTSPVASAAGSVITRQPNFISSTGPRYVIFKQWREHYFQTQYEFSVAMCVRNKDVSRYESGQARAMPNNIRVAMGDLTDGFATELR